MTKKLYDKKCLIYYNLTSIRYHLRINLTWNILRLTNWEIDLASVSDMCGFAYMNRLWNWFLCVTTAIFTVDFEGMMLHNCLENAVKWYPHNPIYRLLCVTSDLYLHVCVPSLRTVARTALIPAVIRQCLIMSDWSSMVTTDGVSLANSELILTRYVKKLPSIT